MKSKIEEILKSCLYEGTFVKPVKSDVYIKWGRKGVNKDLEKQIISNKKAINKYLVKDVPNDLLSSILEYLDLILKLDHTSKMIILEEIVSKIQILYRVAAEDCESPLEFELAYTLDLLLERFNKDHNSNLWLFHQRPIKANERTYRVDILIEDIEDPYFPTVVIECDGHDFHEKTKEQVRKDKQRDRDLQIQGYRVIRFTGSEIFKNAHGCAKEVISFLEALK
jgi:very-short-patch-repair endonuclease